MHDSLKLKAKQPFEIAYKHGNKMPVMVDNKLLYMYLVVGPYIVLSIYPQEAQFYNG